MTKPVCLVPVPPGSPYAHCNVSKVANATEPPVALELYLGCNHGKLCSAVFWARWKANSRRASGIDPGDQITVAAVEGFILEVDPVE